MIAFLVSFNVSCKKDNQIIYEGASDNFVYGLNNNNCAINLDFSIMVGDSVLDVEKLGVYHNEILNLIRDSIDFLPCDSSSIARINTLVNQAISSNGQYADFFDDSLWLDSIFFLNDFSLCQTTNASTLKNKMRDEVLNYISIIENLAVCSSFEIDLLGEILDSILLTETFLHNHFNVEYFRNQIIQNSDSLLFNGLFPMSIIAVNEYSFCFWKHELEGGATDPTIFSIPYIGYDVIGAYFGGMRWIYDNWGTCIECEPERKSREFIRKIGKGAVNGSGGVFSTLFD